MRDAGQAVDAYAIRQGTLAADASYALTFMDGTLTIASVAVITKVLRTLARAMPAFRQRE